jgi:hypothetical protein
MPIIEIIPPMCTLPYYNIAGVEILRLRLRMTERAVILKAVKNIDGNAWTK